MQAGKMVFCALLAVTLCGCGWRKKSTSDNAEVIYPENLTAKEFVAWSKTEQGLREEKTFEDMRFYLVYHPAEWMAMNDLGTEVTAAQIAQESKNYEDLLYFTLRIQLNGEKGELLKYKVAGQEAYRERVSYYSFQVQKDIALVAGNDTLPCSITHFERAFNVTNYSDIMLGFSRKQLETLAPRWEKLNILVNDRIFGHGTLSFVFSKNQVTNTPKLKVS